MPWSTTRVRRHQCELKGEGKERRKEGRNDDDDDGDDGDDGGDIPVEQDDGSDTTPVVIVQLDKVDFDVGGARGLTSVQVGHADVHAQRARESCDLDVIWGYQTTEKKKRKVISFFFEVIRSNEDGEGGSRRRKQGRREH